MPPTEDAFGGSVRVFVHNLPFTCEKRDLLDLFGEMGEIVEIELLRSRHGSFRGICVVEYENADDAERCIRKMNHHRLEGRMITCREDRGTGYVHPETYGKPPKGKGKGYVGGKGGGYERRGGYMDDRRSRRDSRKRRDRNDSRGGYSAVRGRSQDSRRR